MHEPRSTAETAALVCEAVSAGTKLEIRGGGSRAGIGTPDRNAELLSTAGLHGIIAYDPEELVLTARAGTPLSELEAAVEEHKQALAFEPWGAPGSTIGGVIGAGISGSGRVSAGAVRDHLLGFEAISGRGEHFIAGGKVVKNVTGYDLSKLMCGSWGRLAVLTEITLKVLPRPAERLTLCWRELGMQPAFNLMGRAMCLPADVAATAHLPESGETLVRIEGFAPSVAARAKMLRQRLAQFGEANFMPSGEANAAWAKLRGAAGLDGAATLWRISVPRCAGAGIVTTLARSESRWLADWAGGLIWLARDGHSELIRQTVQAAGGHATLVHAPNALRATVPALHPLAPGLATLTTRVRHSFDPLGVFETGRFLDEAFALDVANAN